jgi:hypothetical protein
MQGGANSLRSLPDTFRELVFSPEVPSGPFRTCAVTTVVAAAMLHPPPVAPGRPGVMAARRLAFLRCRLAHIVQTLC